METTALQQQTHQLGNAKLKVVVTPANTRKFKLVFLSQAIVSKIKYLKKENIHQDKLVTF